MIRLRYTPQPIHWAVLIIALGIFVAITGCTGTGSSSPPPAATPAPVPAAGSTSASVTIQNFAFSPASITVTKGTTVTWTNEDSAPHQVLNDASGSLAQGALFSSSTLAKGASYSFRFDTPGTYPYHCSIHPSMTATVTVT